MPYLKLFGFIASFITVFVIYYEAVSYQWLNWDDTTLVIDNKWVKSLLDFPLQTWFNINFYNHDPITCTSHALLIKIFGYTAAPHHLLNIIIHIFNGLLVLLLLKKWQLKYWLALLASFIWLIHPMRVESVVWIAERKDVLYAFFFLLGILSYLNTHKKKWLHVVTFVFFLFSLGAKFAAIVFPFVLLLIDYQQSKKISINAISQKIPYFIVVLIMIWIHFSAEQATIDTEKISESFSFPVRIIFACFALSFYFVKTLVPFSPSPYFPYPYGANLISLPVFYYLSIIFIIAFVIFLLFLLIRKKTWNNTIFIGIAFFIINVSLVLHIIPIGGRVIVAERYAYIGSIGLLYSVFIAIQQLEWQKWLKNAKRKIVAVVLLFFYFSYLIILTKTYLPTWKDSITLWTYVIEKNPTASLAYYNRGHEKSVKKDFTGALSDFSTAIQLKPDYYEALTNRGQLYLDKGDYKAAHNDFLEAYKYEPNDALINNNLGYILGIQQQYKDALNYLNRAIELNNAYEKAYYNRGVVYYYLGEYEKSISDLDIAIRLYPKYYEAYTFKGLSLLGKGIIDNAIKEFNAAININPNYAEAWQYLGYSYLQKKQYEEAINFFNKALAIQPRHQLALYNRGVSNFNLGKREEACKDWQNAKNNGYNIAESLINQYCKND